MASFLEGTDNVPQQAFQQWNDPQGNKLIALNRDGTIYTSGFQLNGAAPLGHQLQGNGTIYADWAIAYGDMHVNSASITITIGATNTFVAIPNSLNSSDTFNVVFNGSNALTLNVSGVYLLVLSIAVQCATASQVVSATYAVNGTPSTNVLARSELIDANHSFCISCSDIQSFLAGQSITIVLENNTAIHNLTIENASLTLVRIF
jgi:hypothetical protein